jgi:hypothetical protein
LFQGEAQRIVTPETGTETQQSHYALALLPKVTTREARHWLPAVRQPAGTSLGE